PEHFRIGINLAWDKLDEYYQRLDETPIYYTAMALHPAYRWDWFDETWAHKPSWVEKAKEMVADVWLSDYAHLEVRTSSSRGDDEPPAKRPRFFNPFEKNSRLPNSKPAYAAIIVGDEYQAWQTDREASDGDVRDPIGYWITKQSRYPRLSRMALDFLTIQPMSAECERLFSAAGKMVSGLRTNLDAEIIAILSSFTLLCQRLKVRLNRHRRGCEEPQRSTINPLINPRVYIHSTAVEYVLHPLCNCLKIVHPLYLAPKWSGCSGSDPWEWMTGVVREICIFELIKSTWHQQFNRYACVVACDLKGHDFEYHDPEWCQLGHVFSIAAKLMLHHPEDKDFWVESMPILMELCFHFKDAFDKSDGLECRLSLTPKEMRKLFLPIFKGMKNVRAALDDEQASERREMLQRGLETRAKGHGTVAQGGEKRKAGDDGEGGAKKQKTSTAYIGSVKQAGCDFGWYS
ncbi:Uncharacterized protein HZ326_24576, partial [Fusarium oxysporum f. sp. albedinis]